MARIVERNIKKEDITKSTKIHRKKINSLDELIASFDKKSPSRVDPSRVARGVKRVFNYSVKVRPSFSSSWVSPNQPRDSRKVKEYGVIGAKVCLFELKDLPHSLYKLEPPEYSLGIEYIKLLDQAKNILMDYKAEQAEIETIEQTREYVKSTGKRILQLLASKNNIHLGDTRKEENLMLNMLTDILVRYTVGFGVFEYFLEDKYIQDAYVDSPASENHVYLSMGGLNVAELYDDFRTNVILGEHDVENMLSRFRYESGRPFSEAKPVLEMDLSSYETRVTVTGKPLSPSGIAMAFRKRSSEPWTLLKLINNGTITSIAAGLLSFLLEGRSTMMIAGSRGAGKTSMLSAILLEFRTSQRIITIEDTLELPVDKMQDMGYNIQSFAVESTLGTQGEMTAKEALRVSLRMGESSIVLGEVRGEEARTLYEAMRTGTAGSSVLGTFHGNSADAVYKRATGDMNIPPQSFMATDIIVVSGLTSPKGSQKNIRKLVQIAELKKEAPEPGEMENLMQYDENDEILKKTDVFSYRSEKIGSIAGNWGLSLEEALKNIEIRARYREDMVKTANILGRFELLSPLWVTKSNHKYWSLIEQHSVQNKIDYEMVYRDWKEWFERGI